ncbi:unnamed protein product [Calypogeia fissa]
MTALWCKLSADKAKMQNLKNTFQLGKRSLGILLLFICLYTLVTFLQGNDCSPSSIDSNYNSGKLASAYCTFVNWSNSFVSSTSYKLRDPSISVQEGLNVSPVLEKQTTMDHIVFGIGTVNASWTERREYVKLWWKEGVTRGFVWTNKNLTSWEYGDPPFKVSEDTSQFINSHRYNKAALRISRIVVETFQLGLPDVDWFVMGDDDTLFFTENLVQMLSKYDPKGMYYIGSHSEDTAQSVNYHYGMAYGGGGFAISYPLAKALSETQDDCVERYYWMFGSDERVKACVAELGVPMTNEPGFYQMDLQGDISGYLAAHQVVPIVSLHHLDRWNPIFYGANSLDDLKRLMKVLLVDPVGLFQQSMCYAKERKWSFSVAWGYVVEIYEGFVPPRELEMATRTFTSWAYYTRETVTLHLIIESWLTFVIVPLASPWLPLSQKEMEQKWWE